MNVSNACHVVDPARLRTEESPGKEGQHRDCDDATDEIACDHVRHALHWRPGALGVRHHLHDLSQHGLRSDLFRAHHEGTAGVERGADYLVSDAFGHRNRFTRQHRFVNGATALQHNAVDRHFLSRPDAERVANMHLRERHILFAAVDLDTARVLRRQSQQRLDRCRRLRARL